MLKLGRKSKKMSGGVNNELPPEQDDIVEQGSSEDCVTPMPAAYSVPNANLNYPGDEIDAMRQVASVRRPSSKKTLPPLFIYIEAGDYQRAIERAKRHPREARTWASIKIKSSSGETTKRLALHQACFKVSCFRRKFYSMSLVHSQFLVCSGKLTIAFLLVFAFFIEYSSGRLVRAQSQQQKKIRSFRFVASFFF